MIAREINEINQKINDIGTNYLDKHPKSFVSNLLSIHTNQPLALRLKNFRSESSSKADYERFLIDCYYRLPKYKGVIAKQIADLFQEEFDKPLTSSILIQSYTYHNLNALGEDFIHIQAPHSFFKSKNDAYQDDQAMAKKLVACKIDNTSTNTIRAYENIWMYLIRVYAASLPNGNNPSKLQEAIENLIRNTFNIPIIKTEVVFNQVLPIRPIETATFMQRDITPILANLSKSDRELLPNQSYRA